MLRVPARRPPPAVITDASNPVSFSDESTQPHDDLDYKLLVTFPPFHTPALSLPQRPAPPRPRSPHASPWKRQWLGLSAVVQRALASARFRRRPRRDQVSHPTLVSLSPQRANSSTTRTTTTTASASAPASSSQHAPPSHSDIGHSHHRDLSDHFASLNFSQPEFSDRRDAPIPSPVSYTFSRTVQRSSQIVTSYSDVGHSQVIHTTYEYSSVNDISQQHPANRVPSQVYSDPGHDTSAGPSSAVYEGPHAITCDWPVSLPPSAFQIDPVNLPSQRASMPSMTTAMAALPPTPVRPRPRKLRKSSRTSSISSVESTSVSDDHQNSTSVHTRFSLYSTSSPPSSFRLSRAGTAPPTDPLNQLLPRRRKLTKRRTGVDDQAPTLQLLQFDSEPLSDAALNEVAVQRQRRLSGIEKPLPLPPRPHTYVDLTSASAEGYPGSASTANLAHSRTNLDTHQEGIAVPRPSFLRTESNRRWTVAAAEVPDELFAAELERLRRLGMRAREIHGVGWAGDEKEKKQREILEIPDEERSAEADADAENALPGSSYRATKSTPHLDISIGGEGLDDDDEEEDEEEWDIARRAMFCCRELLRTERSYRARLQQLYDCETADPVPPLLRRYLPALILASQSLSTRFEREPSAWGVCSAFLEVQDDLEVAFVAWCGIVGEVFDDAVPGGDNTRVSTKSRSRNRPSLKTAVGLVDDDAFSVSIPPTPSKPSSVISGIAQSTANGGVGVVVPVPPLPITTTSSEFQHHPTTVWPSSVVRNLSGAAEKPEKHRPAVLRKISASKSPAVSETNLVNHGVLESSHHSTPTTPTTTTSNILRLNRFSFTGRSFSKSHSLSTSDRGRVNSNGGKKDKPLRVRDLAIQPIQRVTRYVLMYKDLVKYIPKSSPAHAVAEHALECATRIAQRCDKAQGNAFFLRRS